MLARVGTAVVAAALPALLAFRSGGYFPSEWGLVLLVLVLVVLAVGVAGERIGVGRRELVAVSALGGLALWTLVSVAWAPGPDGAVLAAELVLVYAAALGAGVLALDRDRVPWLLGGLLAGIGVVVLWALETRLFQGDLGEAGDLLTGTRLARPLGYANGLGALAALGLVLALGLCVAARPLGAALAGALLVPLAAALYLTLSRGSDLAFLLGLTVLCAKSGSREAAARIGLLLVAPALGVALAARSPLTDSGLAHGSALAAGHRLALELGLLALASAAVALRGGWVARPLARHALLLAGVCLIAVIAAVAAAGPIRLVHRVEQRLQAPPPATGTELNRRVLSVSGSGRTEYWRVAWRMVERDPLLGGGGGSFERWWDEERPVANDARNAHDLYLETLAELGPVGLALLLVALGTPLVALLRTQGPLAGAAGGAYVAWLAHAVLDWDWQIPAVTLTALGCGAALLVLARDGEPVPFTSRRRAAVLVPAVALLCAALVAHVGNRATAGAESALGQGDDASAFSQARRASRWSPWAALPHELAGEAQLARHHDRGARRELKRALELDPDSWRAWYDLATVTQGAEHARALAKAHALNPLAPELSDEP